VGCNLSPLRGFARVGTAEAFLKKNHIEFDARYVWH